MRGGRSLNFPDTLLTGRFLHRPFSLALKKVFGVSTRFVDEIVARFREETVSELGSSAPYSSGARASEGKQPPRGSSSGGGSSRKGSGKQRRRGGSKKQGESDVSGPT